MLNKYVIFPWSLFEKLHDRLNKFAAKYDFYVRALEVDNICVVIFSTDSAFSNIDGSVELAQFWIDRPSVEYVEKVVPEDRGPNFSDCSSGVYLQVNGGAVHLKIPFLSRAELFYSSDARFISNDLRALACLTNTNLCRRGISSYFQFGSQTESYTIFEGVRRCLPGHEYLIDFGQQTVSSNKWIRKIPIDGDRVPINDSFGYLQKLKNEKEIGIYFSGGTDSAYLATRMLDIKERVTLFNCSFGREDGEARIAKEIAHRLGFRFEAFEFDLRFAERYFNEVSYCYSYPFSDISTIASNFLALETGRLFSGIVLDGTGADGSHSILSNYKKWSKTYQMHSVLRRSLADFYVRFALYGVPESSMPFGLLERLARASKNTLGARRAIAFIKNNGLAGVSYHYDPSLEVGIEYLLDNFGAVDEVSDFSFVDMVLACKACFVSKNYEPGLRRGIETLYPFMDHSVYGNSLRYSWKMKNFGSKKSMLTEELKPFLPEDIIYRKKSGFKPPLEKIFRQKVVYEILMDEVLDANGRIGAFIDQRISRKILERAQKDVISFSGYHFLNSLIFLHCWIKQTKI